MKKGSKENKQDKDSTKMAPGSAAKGATTSQNSTSSSQMSGGATPVQGMNQSREKEQGDLRG